MLAELLSIERQHRPIGPRHLASEKLARVELEPGTGATNFREQSGTPRCVALARSACIAVRAFEYLTVTALLRFLHNEDIREELSKWLY